MTGTIMLDDTSNWKYENSFATLALAKAYLNDKADITDMFPLPQ